MNNTALPSRDTILKYSKGATPLAPAAPVAIQKDGDLVTRAIGMLISQWMDVTPDKATAWLKNNFKNRPVSQSTVRAYARDMMNGLWQPTHQGIAFNDQDELIDGQHRLLAIVMCGKTVRMMVTFGLNSKIEGREATTMDCVDRGRPRSVADQLKIQHGLMNGNKIAGVCSALAHLCFGEKVRNLSVGQTLEIYRAFQPGVDFVIEHRSKDHGLRSVGVLAAFAFTHGVNDAATENFFHQLNLAEDIEIYPALKLLRGFLTGEQASLMVASMNKGIAELSVWAVHCEMQTLKVTDMERSPEKWLEAVQHYRVVQAEKVNKIAALFKLPEVDATPAPAPAPVAAPQPAAPAAPKARPTLDKIIGVIEARTGLSTFIIKGRGTEAEISLARTIFVSVARSYGHTLEAIADYLKRPVGAVEVMALKPDQMNGKQRIGFDAVRAKL